jgi:hypothetical protein
MQASQLKALLEKYERGECTPEEEQFVIDWFDSIGKDDDSALTSDDKTRLERKLWASIRPAPPRIKGRTFLWKAAIISIPLLILTLIGYFIQRPSLSPFKYFTKAPGEAFLSESERYHNDGKTEHHLKLADGSRITLQPSSEIFVRTSFDGSKREVELKGEAFFHVKRDPARPFFVYAGDVVTKVLGTSFNIRAYENDGEVTVAVRTGRVSVYANGVHTTDRGQPAEPEVILTPNQQLVYHRQKKVVSKQLVAKPEIIVPNSHLFSMKFDNAQVGDIFAVLEENYGVEIRYDKDALRNCRLTTSMSDEGLYERIEVICRAIGASYSCDEAVITIRSNGC